MTEEMRADGRLASSKALKMLERMDRTEAELTEKLLQKGFTEEAAAEAVRYVKRYGYVDDERYAAHFVSYQKQYKSLRRIRWELKQKGIPDEITEAALEDAASSDEKELIGRLARRKLGSIPEPDAKQIEKCRAYLYRQGFRLHDINDVLDSYIKKI